MKYLVVGLFAMVAPAARLDVMVANSTDTATVLASLLTAAVGGGLATLITSVAALRKQRAEREQWKIDQAAAAERFDLDRLDRSMALLTGENERLYDEVKELRIQARVDHEKILLLEGEVEMAKKEARFATELNARLTVRLSDLEENHDR